MNKILVSRRLYNGINDEYSGISEDGSIQLSLYKIKSFLKMKMIMNTLLK